MNLEEKIKKLDKSFRGLWVSRCFDAKTHELDTGWAVTFIRKGDYCETPNFETPNEALDFALEWADKQ